MRRLVVILSLLALPAIADDFKPWTNAVIYCTTNAANTTNLWINAGTSANLISQSVGSNCPTIQGRFYNFQRGAYFTNNDAAVVSETNEMLIVCWYRQSNSVTSLTVLGGTWNGSGQGIFHEIVGGVVYAGQSAPDNYLYGNVVASTDVHFYAQSFSRSQTNKVIVNIDGTNLTTVGGSPTASWALNPSVTAFGIGGPAHPPIALSGTNIEISTFAVWAGSVMDFPSMITNLYAHGRDYYDPAAPSSGDPSMFREAASYYLRMIQ